MGSELILGNEIDRPGSDFTTFRQARLAGRTIHIVDCDLGLCEALSVIFRLEGYQVYYSTSYDQFIGNFSGQRPDVVVACLELGTASGLNIFRWLEEQRSHVFTVMLTNSPDMEAGVEAMRLGVLDVMAKPICSERLLRVVREALRRNVHVYHDAKGHQVVHVVGFDQLTARENEVLDLIVNGHSNKSAGLHLGISSRTIEVHRSSIMRKLGVRKVADLIRVACA
jgi:two-component system response regulator FixJ